MNLVKNNLNLIKGILISFTITIVLFYILGIILSLSNIPEKIISPAIIIITGISIMIGTSISMIKVEGKGLLKGGMSGLIYFLSIYLLSSIFLKNFEINFYSAIMMIVAFVCGSIGGIIGINLKQI